MPHRNPLQPVALVKPASQLNKQSQACSAQSQLNSNTMTFVHLPHRLPDGHNMDQNLTYYHNSGRQRRPASETMSRKAAQQSKPPSRSHPSTILHHQSSASNRRSRQPIACDPCRASKRKCSGGQPCVSCLKRGGKVECYYDKAAELKLVARQKVLAMTPRSQREVRSSKKRAEASTGRTEKTMDRRSVTTRSIQHATRRAPSADADHQAQAKSPKEDHCDEENLNDVDESEADDAYMETVPSHPTYPHVGSQSWIPASNLSAGYEKTQRYQSVESREAPVTPSPSRRRQADHTRLSTASSQQSSFGKHEMSSPTTRSQQDRSPSESSAFSGVSSHRSELSNYLEAGCTRMLGEPMFSEGLGPCASRSLPPHLPAVQGNWTAGCGRAASALAGGGPPRLPKPLRPIGSSNTIGFSCIGRPAFSKPMRFSTMEPTPENGAITTDGLVGDGALLPSAREGNVPAWIKPYPYPRPGVEPRTSYGLGQNPLLPHLRASIGGPDAFSGRTLAPMIRPPYAPTSQHRSTTSATSSPAGPQTKRFASNGSDARTILPPVMPRDMPLSLLGHPPY